MRNVSVMTASRYWSLCVLASVISASSKCADLTSWTKRWYTEGCVSMKKAAPESAVAVDSEPAILSENAFTLISAGLMPFSSFADKM